jgi:hypothetical protein
VLNCQPGLCTGATLHYNRVGGHQHHSERGGSASRVDLHAMLLGAIRAAEAATCVSPQTPSATLKVSACFGPGGPGLGTCCGTLQRPCHFHLCRIYPAQHVDRALQLTRLPSTPGSTPCPGMEYNRETEARRGAAFAGQQGHKGRDGGAALPTNLAPQPHPLTRPHRAPP